jgi:Extensin-like protein C-terminus
MTCGVRWYLVGSLVLVSLAGCGRGFFSEEREPWRAEAEIACLKSGAVKENAELVRIDPISGPGICGADFPLRVSSLGESNGSFGFADDDLRPPAGIRNAPRWPIAPPPAQAPYYSDTTRPPVTASPSAGPISLTAPGMSPDRNEIDLPPDGGSGWQGRPVRQPYSGASAYPSDRSSAPYPLPRLGPTRPNSVAAFGPVAVKPTATLACPIVSVLDRWLVDAVQPAAMRWFGARVVEIRQISAYSCRGMNGNSHAHISEHAFGNALDIASFTLADGRTISVKDGWKGLPEEQGFLRDVQASACREFSTVLAPGSNVYHYNHIHVDLMRRARRPVICEPAAMSGEEVAARAAQRGSYAARASGVTGSLGGSRALAQRRNVREEEFEDE